MRKNQAFSLAVILGLAIPTGARLAAAQEPATPAKSGAAQSESAADDKGKSWDKPMEQYHLDFSINEMEDGRKINSRQYSTNLSTDEGNEIKIGTRVPVEAKEGEFQYLDVGTSIFARVSEKKGQTELYVRAEISNFAMSDPNQGKLDLHPIVRQIKMGGSTLLPLTKPVVMGSADDPNSKRQFQLEVAVTKVR